MVLARFELPTRVGGKGRELNIFPITRVRDAMRDHLCNGDFSTGIREKSVSDLPTTRELVRRNRARSFCCVPPLVSGVKIAGR